MKKFARCSLFDKTKFSILIIFAFSSWPFFYYGFWTSKVIFVSSALSLAILFLLDIKKVDSIYLVCFSCFVALCWASSYFSVYPQISEKSAQRFVLYASLVLSIALLSTMPSYYFSKAINFILVFFALLSIPCMLLSFAYLFGVDNFIPSIHLNLGGRGAMYLLSPLGIVTENTIKYAHHGLKVVRVNALSEEPGVLGTYVIYLIVINQLYGIGKGRLWINISLNILGTLSYSLFYFVAGWVLLPVAAIFAFIQRRYYAVPMKQIKGMSGTGVLLTGALVSFLLLLSIMAFSKLYSGSSYAVYSYSPFYRLFSGDQQALNNRATYDIKLRQEIKVKARAVVSGSQDIKLMKEFLIGNGPGANSIATEAHFSSWSAMFYDNGILGMMVILLFYFYILVKVLFLRNKLDLYSAALLFPFVLSFYQRPEFMSPLIIICWVSIERYFSKNSELFLNI